MARGYQGASRGGSKSGGAKSGGQGQRRAGAGGAKPKGQVRSGKTVQYSIKDARGNTRYIGTTNNPSRRTGEHAETGTLRRRDTLVVETHPIPRQTAERVEAAKIAAHRRRTGSNPQRNKTRDGKYHP